MEGNQLPLNLELQNDGTTAQIKGSVECLGMTFESDEARRAYFIEKLQEKLQEPEFRQIEGFPIGEDEDILALSDPPYYTACPNPFIEDFINYWNQEREDNTSPESESYHREPFAADVSEGKNDAIYNAHSYHTKVPHKAIMRYILHYTEPGDIVFDGFCGTGMTGVAAQLCGDKATVESLGYRVQQDGTILDENEKPFSKLGARRVILNDLSPAATFIAYNYNTPVDITEFEREAKRILAEVEEECGWMYLTLHQPKPEQIDKAVSFLKTGNTKAELQKSGFSLGKINYTLWSDVFTCSECAGEIVYWEVAVDTEIDKVRKVFCCPHCDANLSKGNISRAWVTHFDTAINQTVQQAKQVPVLINYSVGKKRYRKIPDVFDLALIETILNKNVYDSYPTNRMPEGEESRRNDDIGITHVHHFYTKRNLWTLSVTINKARERTLFLITAIIRTLSKMFRWAPKGKHTAGTSGTLYIPSISHEYPIFGAIERRMKLYEELLAVLSHFSSNSIVTTSSASNLSLLSNSIDYIFTDPPFGGNLMYSELNFIWEAWLKVVTNNKLEAIENKVQSKRLLEYQELMVGCFAEYYRVLKPGCWITVEFHNSKNSVWNAIQEAMQSAGFIIADVGTLDKKQSSFKQVNSSNAVKQDLIISAYKPNTTLEKLFNLEVVTEDAAWEYVRDRLRYVKSFLAKNGQAETIAERQNYLLFDRMVAFYVQKGMTVPLSAAEFYTGLAQRFVERDGMYFLPEQAAEYDKKRRTVKEVLQLELIVINEETAVQWLKQQLTKKPQTYSDLYPQYTQVKSGWSKSEKQLELSEILAQNFLYYEGKGYVPKQIVSWLKQSATHREKIRQIENELSNSETSLEIEDTELLKAARGRWYVPDPNQTSDLEKLREKTLLKEFEEYRQSKQKKLKVFRLEAVRTGFKKAWQERNYQIIIEVAKKISETVLQDDPQLLRWYTLACTRLGEEI
ncbi:DNA methylase [Scytonema sp. UIC 10036]|uniref:DNA methyltransferase n=1 Tax=Scytonema sp. UIC 10036 TaxID=2304196 RepID=UPI0012DA459A|nr:DNA methyltransferase [Scytonema sp. UIC 10036]MUG91472.1 DNA methylase [Scytonema sp. UIC 10036]